MKTIARKWKFLAVALLVLALGLIFGCAGANTADNTAANMVALTGDPQGGCQMTVGLGGLVGTDATVDISNGPQDLRHNDPFDVTGGSNFQWRLTVNGFNSGWKTATGVCGGILEVGTGDWCKMDIDLGGLIGTDATVDISNGPQDLGQGGSAILPTSINIQWRLTVNGFNSGWKTKHVDCNPLVVQPGDWCKMDIDLGGLIGTDATVDISNGPQDLGQGGSAILPTSINIQWRLTVNGFNSGWKTKHVDCNPLVVQPGDWCKMDIDLGGLIGTDATVDISNGPQDLGQGGSAILPTSINIQWRLTVNGFNSGWKTKHVDCTALKVGDGDWCPMHIEMREDLQKMKARVDISNGPQDLVHCNTVNLPTSINIQWRLEVGGVTCGWQTKHIDCTQLAPDPKATVKIPQGLADAGAKVNIRYDSPDQDYGNGDQFDYVPGKDFQWVLKVSGFTSAYKTTAIGCAGVLEVTDADYCLMTIDMPDDLAAAGAKVNIRYDSPNVDYGDGAQVYLPKSLDIQWQLKVSGFTSAYKSKHVDCNPLVVTDADYCLMTIDIPDDLAAAGAKVNIRYDKPNLDYGDGAQVYLPKSLDIQWQLKVSGFTSAYKSKHVDCNPLVVTDADYCKMTIDIPDDLATAGAKVNIRYDKPDVDYGDGAQVYLPKSLDIQWQLKVSGFTSAYKSKHVDCNPLVVTDADYCLMTIDIPDDLAAAGAKVNIRYDSPDKDYGDGAQVYLPMGIGIQWQLKVGGFTSAYKSKDIDCSPLVVTGGDYCLMTIQMRSDVAKAGAKVNIRYDSPNKDYGNGDTVYLPICTDIQWQLKVNRMTCGWYTKHVDCSPLVVDPKATVKIPQGLADAGAKVNIRYDSPDKDYGDGDQFDYVPGKDFQWQLKVSGFTSAYKTTALGCTGILEVTDADYCLMTIDMPDELAAAGAKVDIRYDSPDKDYGDGGQVYLPKSLDIQWQLKVSGFTSAYKSKHVDCNPLVVTDADYCLMTIDIPDDLAAAGAKVNIRYDSPDKDYGDGAQVYLPKSLDIQWQLKVSGFTSAYKSKHVDCNPLVVTDADYCLMTIDIPDDLAAAGAKVNIRYDSPDKDYGDGAQVYLPKSVAIEWQLKVSGFTSAYKGKHVDCSWLVVTDADYCLMGIQVPDGAKVDIRYDSPDRQYVNGNSVYVPICVNIQWRIYIDGAWSGYYTKHVDCSDLVYS